MEFYFTGLTDPGLVRSANQDAYHIDKSGRFVILADGMGGHAGGEEASRLAIQEIQSYLIDNWDSSQATPDLLEAAFWRANQAILQHQQKHPQSSDMGTTAVAVIFRDKQPWCAHVGDSRLYLLHSSVLAQITEDHTWVAKAVKFGELAPDEARSHPWRHILSQCLGREDLEPIDIQALSVQPGDRLLLCSDGLTEELSDQIIASHLKTHPVVEQAVVNLVKAALASGGHDNVTIVLVDIRE